MITMRKLKKKIRAAEKTIRKHKIDIRIDRKKMRQVLASPLTLLASFSAGFLGTFLLIGRLRARKAAPVIEAETVTPEQPKKSWSWLPYLLEAASLGIGALKVRKSMTKHS